MNEDARIRDVKKIAVLKTGGLGDLVVTLPSITALAQTYPDAEIVLLGLPWQRDFLVPGRTPIDRVVPVPIMPGIRSSAQAPEEAPDEESFRTDMQQEGFDLAISFQGKGVAANPFLQKLSARLTAGTWTPGSCKPDYYTRYDYCQSEVIRCLEIVKQVGAETSRIEPEVNVLPCDREILDRWCIRDSRQYVVISPVARDYRRMWPLENYGAVVEVLCGKGLKVILTGSAADAGIVGRLIERMPCEEVVNACGLSLGGFCALASEARLMLAPDTGPLHLARAVNCPSVGIFWAPNVINWGPLSRRRSRPVISWRMECPLCGAVPNDPYPFEPQGTCRHNVSFVRDVTVDQVLEAADELLAYDGVPAQPSWERQRDE